MISNAADMLDRSVMMTAIRVRLNAAGELAPAELELVDSLAETNVAHGARTVLAAEGTPSSPLLVASGWACRQHLLSDGRRQIVSFVIPGDPLFPLTRPALPVPCAAVALTPMVVLSAKRLVALLADPAPALPGLTRAVRQLDQFEEFLTRDHIVRLGRQVAFERMIHLLLELYTRLGAVGLAVDGSFPLPLTQEVLADTLGLSVVHVNRVLQQIRRDKLLELRSGMVTILDLPRMQSIADWTPMPPG